MRLLHDSLRGFAEFAREMLQIRITLGPLGPDRRAKRLKFRQ